MTVRLVRRSRTPAVAGVCESAGAATWHWARCPGLRPPSRLVSLPDGIHVDVRDRVAHCSEGVVGVSPLTYGSELEEVAVRPVFVETKMASQGQAPCRGEFQRRREFVWCTVVFLQQVHFADRRCGHGLVRNVGDWCALLLGEVDREREACAVDGCRDVLQPREDEFPGVAVADAAFDSINVLVGHDGVGFHVSFHGQQGSDACSRFVSRTPSWLQQSSDLGVFLIKYERQIARRIGRHWQDARRQLGGQILSEHPLKKIIEQGHASSGMQVKQLLGDHVEPVLLVVAHRIDCAERPRVGVFEFDGVVPGRQPDALLNPMDRPVSRSNMFFSPV